MVKRYQILVVDDDTSVRSLLVRFLEKKKCICDEAEDGQRALEMIAAGQYDVVVTDLRMPHVQGSTLVGVLLDLSDRPAVVVMTGVTNPQELRCLRSCDIEGFFTKPVDPDLLANEVKAIADRRQLLWRQQDVLSR